MQNDLISRSALLELAEVFSCYNSDCEIVECEFSFVHDEYVKNAPAVDAVEVVRCRDCKYYDFGKRFPDIKWCCRLRNRKGEVVRYNYGENDFCSYGERRADDG